MVTGTAQAALRLLVVQAAWTYERLQGVGVGFASLPLLEPLRADPARYQAAVGRSTELFNAHPYLTGIAVGAAARAEIDGVPGGTVQRLKTALAGPLGSLGDQLFWIGVVPAVMAAMLVALALDAGLPAVGLGVALYLLVRLYVTVWGLRLGLRSGLQIAGALKASGLTDQVRRVGLLAGLLVGAAVVPVFSWLAAPAPPPGWWVAPGLGLAGGVIAALVRFRVPSARHVTLAAMVVVLLWHAR